MNTILTASVRRLVCPGTVRVVRDSYLVVGHRTEFTATFSPGDAIIVGEESREVVAVENDYELRVRGPFSRGGSGWPYGVATTSVAVYPNVA